MATSRQKDPYRNYSYIVKCSKFGSIGFSKVSGLEAEHEKIEYREGADPTTMRKMPGMTSFSDLTFERGKTDNDSLKKWFEEVYDALEGSGDVDSSDAAFRNTITIHLRDASGAVIRTWKAYYAWPQSYKQGDLDAREGNDVLIETLVICHEGLKELDL